MKFSNITNQFDQLTSRETATLFALLMSDSRINTLDHIAIVSSLTIQYENKMKDVTFTVGGFEPIAKLNEPFHADGHISPKEYIVRFYFAFEDFACYNFSISPIKK